MTLKLHSHGSRDAFHYSRAHRAWFLHAALCDGVFGVASPQAHKRGRCLRGLLSRSAGHIFFKRAAGLLRRQASGDMRCRPPRPAKYARTVSGGGPACATHSSPGGANRECIISRRDDGFSDIEPGWPERARAHLQGRPVSSVEEIDPRSDGAFVACDTRGGALPAECIRSLPISSFSPEYLRTLAVCVKICWCWYVTSVSGMVETHSKYRNL